MPNEITFKHSFVKTKTTTATTKFQSNIGELFKILMNGKGLHAPFRPPDVILLLLNEFEGGKFYERVCSKKGRRRKKHSIRCLHPLHHIKMIRRHAKVLVDFPCALVFPLNV